jgi:hypothetical protein
MPVVSAMAPGAPVAETGVMTLTGATMSGTAGHSV